MKKPAISIVVPVYNAEAHLAKCLDSIISQSLHDIEIICVNDGSRDSSLKILMQYAEMDSRIRVISGENSGLSAARNKGIAAAEGEYVLFVDADDYLSPACCMRAYGCAKENGADIVMFGYERIGKENYVFMPYSAPDGEVTRDEALFLLGGDKGFYTWNKLYRRSLFQSVKFPEGRIFEDIATTYLLIHNARKIYNINDFLYYYVFTGTGITSTVNEKGALNRCLAAWEQYEFVKSNGYRAQTVMHLKFADTAFRYIYKNGVHSRDEFAVFVKGSIKKLRFSQYKRLGVKKSVYIMLFKVSPRLFTLARAIMK